MQSATVTSTERTQPLLEAAGRKAAPAFLIFLFLFFLGVGFLSFRQPLTVWDESRGINNALELAASKHWIVTTYNGHPDHWYTKPPLFVWIVTAMIRLGADPMLALRLPSLVAALGSVVSIYLFGAAALRRPLVGMTAALILMCSTLFFAPHVALTGDLDALLTLFETLCALAFWLYVEGGAERKTAWLALSCVCLAMAILTKGVAGALFLPGLFAYALVRPQPLKSLADLRVWLGLLLVAALVLSYYRYRDTIDPGYIHAVFANEIGRYNAVVEGHKGGPLYYLVELLKNFEPGVLAVILGCCLSLSRRNSREERSRSAAIFCAVVAFVFLGVLSGSKTKFGYYCAPALPLLSLLGGFGLVDAAGLLLSRFNENAPARAKLMGISIPLFLALIAVAALAVRTKHVEAHRSLADATLWSTELDKLLQYDPHVQSITILSQPHAEATTGILDYFPVGQYWATRYALPRHVTVHFAGQSSDLKGQIWVIACDPSLFGELTVQRKVERLFDRSQHCVTELSDPVE